VQRWPPFTSRRGLRSCINNESKSRRGLRAVPVLKRVGLVGAGTQLVVLPDVPLRVTRILSAQPLVGPPSGNTVIHIQVSQSRSGAWDTLRAVVCGREGVSFKQGAFVVITVFGSCGVGFGILKFWV
jgi:hypothetical protein